MELSKPFIRLPFQFDADHLSKELAVFKDSDWMEHPSKIAGNLAIPLISLDGTDNNDFAGRMLPTPHLQACSYTQQVLASFDEVLARSRLMRLNAGAEVSPHVDFNYHWYSRVRIHIPIITNPNVIFHCGGQAIHMRAGECWIFDSWRRHNVINSGVQDRVHLVIDTAGSSRFWNLVRESERLTLAEMLEGSSDRTISTPFDKDKTVEIKTERYNVAPVMSPGELHAMAQELISDFSSNQQNSNEGIEKYTGILLDLSHDWRETWQIYGHEEAGWNKYRQLLQRAFNQLGDNPRELLTQSNDVGIKPIIVQRILRAALNVEQFELFQT